jgi:hypothetical protein
MRFYQEFTFGWIIFAVALPLQVLISYLYVNEIGDSPISTAGYLGASFVFLVVYALFYGLTTQVSRDSIVVALGVGLIRKRIPVNAIARVTLVRSPWYFGWGIRIIPHGILYSIRGLQGVELTLRDGRRAVRIGSQNPEQLKSEIEQQLH